MSSIVAKLREQGVAASTPYPNYYTEFLTSKAGLAMRASTLSGVGDGEGDDPYGPKEMTEEEQQAYMNLMVAIIQMQMDEPSTPYPVYYEGHHDAFTPYPVSYYSDEELERFSSAYNHMMGYDSSKPVCFQGQAPLIIYLDSGSTGANEECRQADGKAAFYFTALAGGKSARTLTLPVTTTPTTTTDTTLEPDLPPDISVIGTDFALLQILDLGCQPPSSMLTVELRNEWIDDVVCSRWTVPGWAETLYQAGTSVTLLTEGKKEGGVERRVESQWGSPTYSLDDTIVSIEGTRTSSSSSTSKTFLTAPIELGESSGETSLSIVLISDPTALKDTVVFDVYLAELASFDNNFALPSRPPSSEEQPQLEGEKAAVDTGVLADVSAGPQVKQSGGSGAAGKVAGEVIGVLLAAAFVVGGLVIYRKRQHGQNGIVMHSSAGLS